MKKFFCLCVAVLTSITVLSLSSCSSAEEKEIDKAVATYCKDMNFPYFKSEGISMTQIAREGKYVVFFYELDENVMNVGSIRLKSEALKSRMIINLQGDELASFAKSKGFGIKYSYKGLSTKDTFVMTIEANEL